MPKCNHQLLTRSASDSDTVKCPTCGAVVLVDKEKDPFGSGEPVILKPSTDEWNQMTNQDKHRLYQKIRNHLLIDAKKLGLTKTREKLGVAYSTIYQLQQQWLPMGDDGVSSEGSALGLPKLPEWSDKWPAEVQVKWLSIYEKLLDRYDIMEHDVAEQTMSKMRKV